MANSMNSFIIHLFYEWDLLRSRLNEIDLALGIYINDDSDYANTWCWKTLDWQIMCYLQLW